MNAGRKAKKLARLLFGRTSPLPENIQIEITNRCDSSCPMCPRESMAVPAMDMPFERFGRIVAGIPSAGFVTLTGWGEPLLHPQFAAMVQMVNEALPRAKVRFTTNGRRLKPPLTNRLLALDVEQIAVSIEEASPTRSSGSSRGFVGHSGKPRTLENVVEFIALKGVGSKPDIVLQTVMLKDRGAELERLVHFAAEHGIDSVNLVRLDIRPTAGIVRPTLPEEREIVRRARHVAGEVGVSLFCANDQGLLLRGAGHFDRTCLRTDDSVYIDVEGNLAPCCNLREHHCGNILTNDLRSIWKGRAFEEFRSEQGRICDGCDALKYDHHHREAPGEGHLS